MLLLQGAFLSFSEIGDFFTEVKTPRVFNNFTNSFRIMEAGSRLLKTLGADFNFNSFGRI